MFDEPQAYKYFAFISYSRKDSKVAAWLQKRLEWFRFPVKLVPEDRCPPKPPYVRPIYRDKTNLEVTDEHYWQNIRRALEESRFLIILCSPHSAKSEPVNMEVEHFLKTHNGDAGLMVPVIVSGNVTSTGEDAALCPAMRTLGDTLISRNLPTMVPDVVETGIVAFVAFVRTQIFGFAPDTWEGCCTSLLAYLLSIDSKAFGDHIRRQERRRLMRNQALMAGFAVLAMVAWFQRSAALEAKLETEKANAVIVEKNAINLKNLHEASMSDFSVALQRIEQDDRWSEGVAHMARALDWEPTNRVAAMRLYNAITFRASEESLLRHVIDVKKQVKSASFSPDGKLIISVMWEKTAQMWDAATGLPFGAPMVHEDEVECASFSPDGQRIVTASGDYKRGEARLWDTATGRPLGEPMRHDAEVCSAFFSPDGRLVITASWDDTARLWDAATGKPLGEPMRHDGQVNFASFNPDGTRIVTACQETAQLWEVATSTPLGEPMHHEVRVESAIFSPDGKRIVTTHSSLSNEVERGEAWLWDAATGAALGEPMRHGDGVESVSFSPDGTRIVTASRDKTARLWDADTGQPLGEPMRHDWGVSSASFSPDGARILTASVDRSAQVWDAFTGKRLGEPMRHGRGVLSACYSPDGTRIVTASGDDSVRLWEAPVGQSLGEPIYHDDGGLRQRQLDQRQKVWIEGASFGPDGSRIVTTLGKTARLWDAHTAKPLGQPMRHEDRIECASFSPDGSRILTASDDQTARLWDAGTGLPLGDLMHHASSVTGANFDSEGKRVVTSSLDGTARIWDAFTTKPLGKPMRHTDIVNGARFSPDGRRIVTISGNYRGEGSINAALLGRGRCEARLWDSATGQPLGEPMRHGGDEVVSASFNSDSTLILTVGIEGLRVYGSSNNGDARLWNAANGDTLGELTHGMDLSASFSPDGTRIVTAGSGRADLWDTGERLPVGQMHHDDRVNSANFSPDGSLVVTASADKTARLWDAVTGKPLSEPMRHGWGVENASCSADRTRILTISDTARLWEVESLLHLPAETPEWVREWARAVAGWKFDADAVIQPMSGYERIEILQTPHEGDDPWSRLARWLVTDPTKRTTHPDSPHTCREIAERERDFGTQESLESALRYDPTLPLTRLLLAKFETNARRATFLRDYDLKRLPSDPALWSRAAASLVEQKDFRRAQQAAEKALRIDPNNAQAKIALDALKQAESSK